MENKGFRVTRRDLLAVSALILLAAGIWLGLWLGGGGRDGENWVVATLDGREILRLDLTEAPDQTIGLAAEYGVPASFEVRAGRIRFIEVDCPDHICENTGFISEAGQSAICMPNRAALVVYGADPPEKTG